MGVVFTGDFVFKDGIGRTDLYSGDTNEMIFSLNEVFTQFSNDYLVYPGHGDKDTVKSIKNNNLLVREYLND
jgi:glyoxylase-like metal-dependent hydrolase (beta-lactamase superfamily II)